MEETYSVYDAIRNIKEKGLVGALKEDWKQTREGPIFTLPRIVMNDIGIDELRKNNDYVGMFINSGTKLVAYPLSIIFGMFSCFYRNKFRQDLNKRAKDLTLKKYKPLKTQEGEQ